MRRLRIVGDGERDAVTLPPLVRGMLDADFTCDAQPWPRLNRSEKKVPGYVLKGPGLKLLYFLDSARHAGADGVVATVDADRSRRGERLGQLKHAREADRSLHAPLPTALGEAIPHNEVWLLDDPVAVRDALRLPVDHPVPNVRDCGYPKSVLEQLHRASPRSGERPIDLWPDIASRVTVLRCQHRRETGLEAFAEEVRQEIAPLFPGRV